MSPIRILHVVLPLPTMRAVFLCFLLFLPLLSLSSAQSTLPPSITVNGQVVTFDFCRQIGFGPLCWTINNTAGTMEVGYQSQNGGQWVGLSFAGSTQMILPESSAVIGWTGGPAGPFIGNFDLTNQVENFPGATTLGLTNANVSTDSSGVTTLLFTRNLTSSNPAVPVASIDVSGSNFILEAQGQATPSSPQTVPYHGNSVTQTHASTVSFTTGAVVALADPLLPWKHAHACMMTIAFGLLFPLGIISARFFKGYGPIWFHLHRAFTLLALALITVGFSIGWGKIGRGFYTTHLGIGTYVFSAMLFQPFNSLIRPHAPAPGEKPTHLRLAWQLLHHWNARIAYVFGIANIYIGFSILLPGNQYVVLFSVLWAFVMACAVLLQVYVLVVGDLGQPKAAKRDGKTVQMQSVPKDAAVADAEESIPVGSPRSNQHEDQWSAH